MAKFKSDYVNLIANNLRDRYKSGFPVLKELVQNADDAGATSLVFGYHSGFNDEVEHELLAGPALWVLNNGRFLAQDKESIESFGLNSKAGETGAIGKFGLGMKSVFHLCEAFFYVASDGERRYAEILSPWFRESGAHQMHMNWEQIGANDAQALNAVVDPHLTGSEQKSWFMLWVPLRRRAHVPKIEGQLTAPIIDRYPGDEAGKDLDFFTEADTERKVGRLLPLLRNLQRISFVGTESLQAFDLRVEMHEGSRRLDHVSNSLWARGCITDLGPRGAQLHFVAAQTAMNGSEPFESLKASVGWPSSIAIVEGGRRAPVPDKAQPEGAVVFSHADKRAGCLTLQWAVFLPTEEGRYRFESYIPDTSREYNITLHGQFFVDAGRRGIDGMDRLADRSSAGGARTAESSVQLAWNQALAQQLVLPGLLPALSKYVEAEALSDEQATALTDALLRCAATGESDTKFHFIHTYREYLCKDVAWVRALRPDGAMWTLLPSEAKCLPMPRPANNDHVRPWRALPGLHQLTAYTLIDSQAPHISPPPSHWTEELLEIALNEVSPATLLGEVELKYLVEFLRMHKDRALNTARVQHRLVRLIREALGHLDLAELRGSRQLFKQLIELLPETRWFGLGARSKDAKSALPEWLFRHLLEVDTDAILLPADLVPSGNGGCPSEFDLSAWLRQLDNQIAIDQDNQLALDLAEQLLEGAGRDYSAQFDLIRRNSSLQVLRATDVRSMMDVATSLDALVELGSESLIFRSTNPKNPRGLTNLLSQAVTSLPIHVVRGSVGHFIKMHHAGSGLDLPSAEDSTAIFRCIGSQSSPPALGNEQARSALLAHVSSADLRSREAKDGVRYLLHGDPTRFQSDDALWKRPSGQETPWIRLWRMTIDDPWSVLSGELSSCITDKSAQELNIRAVEQVTVIGKLKTACSFDRVDAQQFTEGELDLILGQIEDEQAWRKLPIHRDVMGRHGPITARCFLEGGPSLPEGFGTEMRFITRSKDRAHEHRQLQCIPCWDSDRAAETVLRVPDAKQHWRYLMDLLQESGPTRVRAAAWKEVAWLPLQTSGAIAPSSLIHIEGMAADVSALSAQCHFAFAGLADLSAEVHAHPGFEYLPSLVPTGQSALPALGTLMVSAGMWVGSFICRKTDLWHKHRSLLCSLSSLLGWPIVFKATEATSVDAVASHLLKELDQPLQMSVIEEVLCELTNRQIGPAEHPVYMAYLQEWATTAGAQELRSRLSHLRLLAADGTWRVARELVNGAPGIEASYSLHPQVAEILKGIAVSNDGMPQESLESDPDQNCDELDVGLERWCEAFEQSSVRPAFGALIGLFGKSVRALAERFLEPITYETYLHKLGWEDPGYDDGPHPRLRWMGGYDAPDEPFARLKPQFIESNEAAVVVKSLTGEEIRVPVTGEDAVDTLLAGPLNWLGGYGVQVRMRPVECLRSFSLDRQKQILQRTAEDLLIRFYNQEHGNLSELWALFEEADQVELDIAQSLILQGLPQLFEQLATVKKNPLIAMALRKVDKGRRQIANAERSSGDLQDAYDEFKRALEELEELVNTNSDVQAALLDGIRSRIKRYQYEQSSIPFELLQNADDAVVEYQEMLRAERRSPVPEADIGHFVVDETGQGLMLMHWGRPINYTGRHQIYRDDYAKDLERMLMLGASAKDSGDGVTGKFGLGFKSVLLASSRPIVASGDLHFEIVAGCLPQRAQLSASAKSKAAQYKRSNLRPTVLELPLDEDQRMDTLIDRFESLAGLCTVFTRQIKHIEIKGATHSWRPQRLIDVSQGWCEIGQVQVPTERGEVPSRLLVFRCQLGAAALRLDGKPIAFDRKAKHPVPAIWVTEPTRGTAASGILINADFEIDTGRAGLAQSSGARRNMNLAEKLAIELSPAVTDLVDQSRADWSNWSIRLASSPQMTAAHFWHAAWVVMFGDDLSDDASQDAKVANVLVAKVFSLVVGRTGVVPNGLPGNLGAFAAPLQLRLSVNYARMQSVLTVLAQWPAFVDAYPLSTWCGDDVAVRLRQNECISDEEVFIEELDRSVLIEALGHGNRLELSQLGYMASVIQAWPKGSTEDQGWRNELASIHFRTQAGAWKTAAHLYFSSEGADDLLTRIAPGEFLLDPEYYEQLPAWRVLCQYLSPREFQSSDVARWCLDAELANRPFVIQWLANNLDRGAVWHHILEYRWSQRWLFELGRADILFEGMEAALRDAMLARLQTLVSDAMPVNFEQDQPVIRLDLLSVQEWWAANRERHVPRYDRMLWPDRIDRSKLAQDDVIDRETWMTLFSLGVFRRFGRVKDEQNRGFLDFLYSRGWWSTITEVHPDHGAEQWMNILREYADQNTVTGEYEHWMDSFPRLYRLARWCTEYVELFRGLQFRDAREARSLLTPASDSSLSGSGFEAGTLHRTLRFGHNLVIRELLRAQVLNSNVAQSMAFMPSRGVLDLLAQMGHAEPETSEQIHALLVEQLGDEELATFCGDYDIPLILLANDEGLRQEVVAWKDSRDDLAHSIEEYEEASP